MPETLQLKGGLQKISLSELLNRVNTVEEILPNMKMKIEEETLKKKSVRIQHQLLVKAQCIPY